MSTTFVDYFKIDADDFLATGAFNICLDKDSKLYLDPVLIKQCSIPEFYDCSSKITNYFSKIIRLVKLSKVKGDIAWDGALRLLTFKEIKNTCLGYSASSNSGNSIGKKISIEMLELAKELIEYGAEDPIIYEVASFLKKGVGCDRVSDILTNILIENIIQYSSNITKKLKIELKTKYIFNDIEYELAKNPFTGDPIFLVPYSVLSKLPVIDACLNIGYMCDVNSITRSELSKYIRFEENKEVTKDDINIALKTSPEFRSYLLNAYRNLSTNHTSHINQTSLQIKKDTEKSNLNLDLIDNTDILTFVNEINDRIKDYIENKGGHKLFHIHDEKITESYAQELYRYMTTLFCKEYDIDISPEVDHGRGPVDFKFSKGYNDKVIVEVKLTTNSHIKNGLLNQLPIYSKASDSVYSILLVFDIESKGFEKITKIYDSQSEDFKKHFFILTIDANDRLSASKVR